MGRRVLAFIAVVTPLASLILQGCFVEFGKGTTGAEADAESEAAPDASADAESTPAPTYPPDPCDDDPAGLCIFHEANANLSTGWAPNAKCSDGRSFCQGYDTCGGCHMFKPCCKWRLDSEIVVGASSKAEGEKESDSADSSDDDTEDESKSNDDPAQGVEVCQEGHKHACPAEWKDGGFHCNDHGGCRTAEQGPFHEATCKEQCFMAPDTNEEASKSEPDLMHDTPVCHAGHEHECPAEWKDGGFICNDHGGCRHVDEGPFPKADCKDQCFIAPHTKEGAKALVEDIIA